MKYILTILAVLLVVFLFFPQKFYRITDLIFSGSEKFKVEEIGEINFSENYVYQKDFVIERSGYYEFGLILNNSKIKISSIKSDFNSPVIIEILTKNGDVIVKNEIITPKFYKPAQGTIDIAEEVVFMVVSINTIKNGNNYIVRITSSNSFLNDNKKILYRSISGYY